MFRHIPFLRKHANNVDEILENWREYKIKVPTYGAIILNEDLTHVLLAQSYWNKTSWGFPKGKVNEEEAPHLCAVREVMEETGYSIADKIDPDQYSEVVINEQVSRLFFIPGIFFICSNVSTLVSLINEHAHYKKISDFSSLLALIRACSINYL